MFERLQAVEDRYDQLNELLSDPEIVSDITKLRDYSKEQSGLQETVEVYREYKRVIERTVKTQKVYSKNRSMTK